MPSWHGAQLKRKHRDNFTFYWGINYFNYVPFIGEESNVYKISVRRPEGKRLPGRPTPR
jgi:hypothetical protein